MEKKQLVAIVGIVLLIAVFASLITAFMVGNSLKKNQDEYLKDRVYTKQEIDTKMKITTTNQGVLDVLSKCQAFEMGTAEPQQYFGKSSATGREMCKWKSSKIGVSLTCISAGRIYSDDNARQQGYGVWSCDRDAVSPTHNGWAFCCSTEDFEI